MKSCTRCGSHAINEHMHGRVKGRNANLCDVCYWRHAAEGLEKALLEYTGVTERAKTECIFGKEAKP